MQMSVVKKTYREFRATKRYYDRMRALLSDSGTLSQSAQSPRFVLFGSPEYNNVDAVASIPPVQDTPADFSAEFESLVSLLATLVKS